MTQFAVSGRNAMLDGFGTDLGTNAVLQIRSGPPPTDCAAADSGTLLASYSNVNWAAAASGAKLFSGTPLTGTTSSAGLAGHFRIKNTAGSATKAQGPISQPWAASTLVQVGQQMHNGGNVYRCTTGGVTASAGGPTGTGTGISDGAAVWSYVDKQDMTLDNTVLTSGQGLNINSYSLTQSGA
jgi:hypothetical protein